MSVCRENVVGEILMSLPPVVRIGASPGDDAAGRSVVKSLFFLFHKYDETADILPVFHISVFQAFCTFLNRRHIAVHRKMSKRILVGGTFCLRGAVEIPHPGIIQIGPRIVAPVCLLERCSGCHGVKEGLPFQISICGNTFRLRQETVVAVCILNHDKSQLLLIADARNLFRCLTGLCQGREEKSN